MINKTPEVLQALVLQAYEAAKAIGTTAERHAVEVIDEANRVDTGLMKNSITSRVQQGESEYNWDIFVGTNVFYAKYHELGTGLYNESGKGKRWAITDNKGRTHWVSGIRPIHFLQRAVSEHTEEYKDIEETFLST